MMKTRLSLLALFIFAISMPALADADIPLKPQHYNQDHQGEDGESVIFHGSVYASPCVLVPQSRLQVIDMGEISAGRFHQVGDRSQPVRVHIEFRDCLKGASQARDSIASRTTGNRKQLYTTGEQAVQLTFIGESDAYNRRLLHLTGSISGAGIRLLDVKERALDINQTQSPFIVKTGDSSLTFFAVLESTAYDVTAGNFSGLLRLKMEYL